MAQLNVIGESVGGESLLLEEVTADPAQPQTASTRWKLYFKSTGLFFREDSGTVYSVPSGSGGANQVAFWTGTYTLSGDAGFTFIAATDTLTVGGNYAFQSGVGFSATFDHANTAERTYTFPDASGTVPLGTGTANQVAYWSSTNALTGDAGLTYDTVNDGLTVNGWIRGGTAADAVDQGDASIGILNGQRIFHDSSAITLTGYDDFNLVAWQLSGIASTNNIFNSAMRDIDTIINGDTVEVFRVDASTDRVGIGIALPLAKAHILATTEQLRLGYDATTFMGFFYNPSLASGTTLALNYNGATPEATVSQYSVTIFNAGAASLGVRDVTNNVEGFLYAFSGGIICGAATNHSLFLRTNNTNQITVLGTGATTIAQWLNVGTATAASVQGEIACSSAAYIASDSAVLYMGSGFDVRLYRDAAAVLGLRNGTAAQEFRVFNTYTSDTNKEFGKLEWASNVFNIGTEKGSGGGTARSMAFQTDATTRWTIDNALGGGFVGASNLRFSHGTSALATTATEGFFHIQSCAGAPTGVPASIPTGQIPTVYDTTNNRIYFYTGGAWRYKSVDNT